MELLRTLIDLILHLDSHLQELVRDYGVWVYAILFLIIFCETGLVVTPILPGDSLLFVAGALAGAGAMNVHLLALLLCIAAVLGDAVNFWVGHYIGPKVFKYEDSRFFKKAYLEKAHAFYEKHGGKTIILARFIPIVRTYAPFVAGVSRMDYRQFVAYNIIGAIIWVGSLTYAGYFFGNIPWIKQNLTLVIISIVFLSILPAIIEYLRSRRG